MNAFRGPLGLILIVVVVVASALAAHDTVVAAERKAIAREREVLAIAGQARELTALRVLVQEMRRTSTPAEPLAPVVERVAGAEGITVTSTQGAGDVDAGPYRERRAIVRVGGAALGPFKRFIGRLESAQPGLLVRELTVRRSIGRSDRLDAELILGQLDPGAAASRPEAAGRASSSRGTSGASTGSSPGTAR